MARYLLIALTGLVLLVGCSRAPESESVTDVTSVDASPVAVSLDVARPKFRLDSDETFAIQATFRHQRQNRLPENRRMASLQASDIHTAYHLKRDIGRKVHST